MSEDELNTTDKARWNEPLPRKTYKDSTWEFPVKTTFLNADVPGSRSVLSEADIRRIVAEELAKAPFVPENAKAYIRDLQEQMQLMADHNDALMMRMGTLEKELKQAEERIVWLDAAR